MLTLVIDISRPSDLVLQVGSPIVIFNRSEDCTFAKSVVVN